MITLRAKVDTSQYGAMCRELAKACDVPPEEALTKETGKVLEQAVKNTKAADTSKIKSRFDQAKFSLQPAGLYSPRRKARRHPRRGGKILYNLSYRYPNSLWGAIQTARRADLQRILKARGLAKRSWYEIAEKLGIKIEVPGYVKNAIASTGRTYEDVIGEKIHEAASARIHIENSQPTVNLIGGEEALQKAIDGRVSFFLNNLQRDVFQHLEQIVRKYPGIRLDAWKIYGG
jgi:hypothetical protein